MKNIAEARLVLKLNKHWREVGVSSVGKAIVDLVNGVVSAMDIDWPRDADGNPLEDTMPTRQEPVTWKEWIKLPVRIGDLSMSSINMTIRVPTVVITSNYDGMPRKKPKKVPSNQGVKFRDGGRCQYTNELIEDWEGSVDHVIPLSRGGTDSWDNVVWAKKDINSMKGNRLNSEAGLRLIRQPRQPREIEVWETIVKPQHRDWIPFMTRLRVKSR